MGSPSSIATFDPKTWYYASRRVERDTLGEYGGKVAIVGDAKHHSTSEILRTRFSPRKA